MNIKLIRRAATIAVCGMAMLNVHAAAAQGAIDNSASRSRCPAGARLAAPRRR
jgi:hypothetical protein